MYLNNIIKVFDKQLRYLRNAINRLIQTSLSGATEQKSLAISMLNVALPGVSFIDLGEEVGNRKYDYNVSTQIL